MRIFDMLPTTELGTKEIHKRRSVMVEGGSVPRAKVMDQAMIDRYLMKGYLTLAQHQAGEYLLEQASKSGIYAKAPPPDHTGGGSAGSTVPMGMFPFGRTLTLVKRRYGPVCAYLVQEVVCHDWDVSDSETRMEALRKGLQLISERRMMGGRNPARHLRG
jgi:hypothetical protein